MIGGILLSVGLGCTSSSPDPGLLLVLTDGIRGDRIGRPLHSSAAPQLTELARVGTRFDRMYATSTSAPSTMATVFSGQLPMVHGERGSAPVNRFDTADWWFKGTVSSFESSPSDLWSSLADIEPAVDGQSPVDLRVVGLPVLGRTQAAHRYDAALQEADERIGSMVNDWRVGHPRGTVVIVGLRGALAEARFDAELGLTDDWLHVPLIIVGPSIPVGWAVSDPVSAVDVGTWLGQQVGSGRKGVGQNPLHGGSEYAYHESVLGAERFGSVRLEGFTGVDGRFVYGTYGEWYSHHESAVRPYPDPVSNHTDHRETLRLITGRTEPSVLDADAVDPRALSGAMTLVNKAQNALQQNRLGAAKRIADRLRRSHPNAPAVKQLEASIAVLDAD